MDSSRRERPEMEIAKVPRKSPFSPFLSLERLALAPKLWCGKVQGLCDGTACATCHLFPNRKNTDFEVDRGSLLSSPSLIDHGTVGLTKEDED
ncbi:MAG: hypothetical protein ACMUIE_03220 [Thermoplasmatota archaeon]